MRMRLTPVLLGRLPARGRVLVRPQHQAEPRPRTEVAMDDKIILKRHERLGKVAWDEMVAQYGCQFSDDYRDGFIDGFVDYLTYGGYSEDGQTERPIVPAVPPPYYRRAKNMSPEGLKASEDWFTGFRHGSNTALASGLRKLVTVPVFDPPDFSSSIQGRYQTIGGPSNVPSTAAPGSGPTSRTANRCRHRGRCRRRPTGRRQDRPSRRRSRPSRRRTRLIRRSRPEATRRPHRRSRRPPPHRRRRPGRRRRRPDRRRRRPDRRRRRPDRPCHRGNSGDRRSTGPDRSGGLIRTG